jgi:hypothetical protein
MFGIGYQIRAAHARNKVATLCTTCFNVEDVCILPTWRIYVYIFLLFSQ